MAVTTYPINTTFFTPILPNGLPSRLTLYNASTTETITINDSTAGSGFPLASGATISWDENKPLYCSATATANLVVLDNGGSIDNPSVLAQLIVDSGLGQAVADALVASALAANIGAASPVPPSAADIGTAVGSSVPVPPSASDIGFQVGEFVPSASSIGSAVGSSVPVPPSASAIGTAVGSSVPVPPSAASIGTAVGSSVPSASSIGTAVGSSVPVPPSAASIGSAVGSSVPVPPSASSIATSISTSGAPPLDVADSIYTNTTASTAAAFSTIAINVAKYQSLKIEIGLTTGGATATPQLFRDFYLQWGSLSSGVVSDAFTVMDGNNVISATSGYAAVIVPARAGTLTITSPAAASAAVITVRVIGSYAVVPEMRYVQLSNYWGSGVGNLYGSGTDRMQAWFVASKAAGTALEYPTVTGSRAKIYMSADTVTSTISFIVEDATSANVIHFRQNAATGAAYLGQADIFIPNRPVAMRLVGAGTNVRFSLVYAE